MRVFFAIVYCRSWSSAARAEARLAPTTRFEGARRVGRGGVGVLRSRSLRWPSCGRAPPRAGPALHGGARARVLQSLFDHGPRRRRTHRGPADADAAGADGRPRVRLRFVVRPQVLVGDVDFEVGVTTGTGITEDELRARLHLLESGRPLTEQALRQNADAVQVYLRDRGFYRAEVSTEQRLDATRTRANVLFRVEPGPPTLLENFTIDIEGFDRARLPRELPLRQGERFTLEALSQSVARVREAVIATAGSPRSASRKSASTRPQPHQRRVKGTRAGSRSTSSARGQREAPARTLPVLREGNIEPSAIYGASTPPQPAQERATSSRVTVACRSSRAPGRADGRARAARRRGGSRPAKSSTDELASVRPDTTSNYGAAAASSDAIASGPDALAFEEVEASCAAARPSPRHNPHQGYGAVTPASRP